jgi:type II secretory pathway component GspD/PulD (secretin)
LLGVLFKHQQKADTKKELLIFLTPHVVSVAEQMAKLTTAEDRGAIMSHKAFETNELDRFFDRLPVKPITPVPPDKKKK